MSIINKFKKGDIVIRTNNEFISKNDKFRVYGQIGYIFECLKDSTVAYYTKHKAIPSPGCRHATNYEKSEFQNDPSIANIKMMAFAKNFSVKTATRKDFEKLKDFIITHNICEISSSFTGMIDGGYYSNCNNRLTSLLSKTAECVIFKDVAEFKEAYMDKYLTPVTPKSDPEWWNAEILTIKGDPEMLKSKWDKFVDFAEDRKIANARGYRGRSFCYMLKRVKTIEHKYTIKGVTATDTPEVPDNCQFIDIDHFMNAYTNKFSPLIKSNRTMSDIILNGGFVIKLKSDRLSWDVLKKFFEQHDINSNVSSYSGSMDYYVFRRTSDGYHITGTNIKHDLFTFVDVYAFNQSYLYVNSSLKEKSNEVPRPSQEDSRTSNSRPVTVPKRHKQIATGQRYVGNQTEARIRKKAIGSVVIGGSVIFH